ncbi:hypothetical protein MNBD_ACTINO02-3287, partial [hydrothermal vent metagenome]
MAWPPGRELARFVNRTGPTGLIRSYETWTETFLGRASGLVGMVTSR